MTSYGSKRSEDNSRTVDPNEQVKYGVTYSANFTIDGIRTIVPGWEDDAINRIRLDLMSRGANVTYIGIDTDNNGVDVQWIYPQTSDASAMIAPIIWAAVVIIMTVLAIWLIVTITGSVKEISNVITNNPAMIPLIYGGVAIVALALILIIKRKRDG